MVGVLIVTHGRLGEALLESVAMLVNNCACVRAVGFQAGQGVEDLEASVRTALSELEPNDGVFCMADLPGGSPARVLGTLFLEHPHMEVVTGANLPMLAEVLISRGHMGLEELVGHALRYGAEGIVDLGAILRQERAMGGGNTAND